MKNLVVLLVFQFLILSKGMLQAQWVPTNGPGGGIVSCFAVSGTNIFAGTYYNGVFFSTNSGGSWIQSGLANIPIQAITVSGTKIFAATYSTRRWI
jgi:hypothetical protein